MLAREDEVARLHRDGCLGGVVGRPEAMRPFRSPVPLADAEAAIDTDAHHRTRRRGPCIRALRRTDLLVKSLTCGAWLGSRPLACRRCRRVMPAALAGAAVRSAEVRMPPPRPRSEEYAAWKLVFRAVFPCGSPDVPVGTAASETCRLPRCRHVGEGRARVLRAPLASCATRRTGCRAAARTARRGTAAPHAFPARRCARLRAPRCGRSARWSTAGAR